MKMFYEVLYVVGEDTLPLITVTESVEYGVTYMNLSVNGETNEKFISSLSEGEYTEYTTSLDKLSMIAESPITLVDKRTVGTILTNMCKVFGLVLNTKNEQVVDVKDKEGKLTFDTVIGMNEVKDKLHDVIDQFNNPELYKAWNVKPIKSILFYGPPGTGKSYISEALANELSKEVKFIKKSCGELIDKYLGQTAKNIIKMFEDARKAKFAVLYLDEIDAIASKRSGDDNNKERNAALNELLIQMANPENENIFMIFATNMLDLLDPAFLRSGRCDFKIEIPLPDFECRKGILELNSKGRPLADDVDFAKLARNMSGMNCADMTNVANEAARRALKAKKSSIEQTDFENAFEEMICGVKSETTKLDPHEKDVVAVHETGHLLANEVYDLDKTKKISILPRGNTLGYVLHANEEQDDKFLQTERELLDRVKMMLAGRAAEDLIFGEITTGSADDLEKANRVVKNMVYRYGFAESFGLRIVDERVREDLSVANDIVNRVLKDCYSEVKNMLREHKDILISFSELLKDREEMNGDEIYAVLDIRKMKEATNE